MTFKVIHTFNHCVAGARDYRTIAEWQIEIHKWAHSKGFYAGECGAEPCHHVSGNPMSALMLVVTELAEAAEALRNNNGGNFAEELADATIRILDLSESMGIDLEAEIAAKMVVNRGRPHKHGKEF